MPTLDEDRELAKLLRRVLFKTKIIMDTKAVADVDYCIEIRNINVLQGSGLNTIHITYNVYCDDDLIPRRLVESKLGWIGDEVYSHIVKWKLSGFGIRNHVTHNICISIK
jgi:hypothetical protein